MTAHLRMASTSCKKRSTFGRSIGVKSAFNFKPQCTAPTDHAVNSSTCAFPQFIRFPTPSFLPRTRATSSSASKFSTSTRRAKTLTRSSLRRRHSTRASTPPEDLRSSRRSLNDYSILLYHPLIFIIRSDSASRGQSPTQTEADSLPFSKMHHSKDSTSPISPLSALLEKESPLRSSSLTFVAPLGCLLSHRYCRSE